MAVPTYNLVRKNELAVLEFSIPTGVIETAELPAAVEQAPHIDGNLVVCLNGRGPVWLFSALTHKYHYTRAVSTYEPRLGACVVTASHDPKYKVGDLIRI
jgi:CRISPR-associated Csx3 family protein